MDVTATGGGAAGDTKLSAKGPSDRVDADTTVNEGHSLLLEHVADQLLDVPVGERQEHEVHVAQFVHVVRVDAALMRDDPPSKLRVSVGQVGNFGSDHLQLLG